MNNGLWREIPVIPWMEPGMGTIDRYAPAVTINIKIEKNDKTCSKSPRDWLKRLQKLIACFWEFDNDNSNNLKRCFFIGP